MMARGALWRILTVGLPWIGGTLAALALAAFLFAWSGVYNVSARAGHWSATVILLQFGLDSSVRTQSLGIDPPPLDDQGLAALGANYFALGCAPCHGAPGLAPSPITRAMLPEPPPLSEAVADWETHELYWIVKNGLKYTGMPGWVAADRGDEVWAVVAFLEALPEISPETYEPLTGGGRPELGGLGGPSDLTGVGGAAAFCSRCHDDGDSPPVSPLVPELGGQSAEYIVAALEDFRAGHRASGIMQPVASRLDDDEIDRLAEHFAELSLPAAAGRDADPEARERGQTIAVEGVPSDRVPGCLSCHGDFARPVFPRLDGLSATYLRRQLELFRSGVRSGTSQARVMEAIAGRLTDEQFADAAAYFSSLRPRSKADTASGADQ